MSSSKRPNLSIVIPAYREAKRIGKTLDNLALFIKKDDLLKTLEIEVIVVSADSDDNTHEIIKNKSNKFKNFIFIKAGPRLGKGRDVRLGMLRAHGQAVLFMDADLATPLEYLPIFYNHFKSGNSVVVATRNLKRHHPELFRRSLSITGNILYRLLGGVWIEDSQCGFKLFSARVTKLCFSKMTTTGWGFDMEILTIAKSNGYKIKTVRVDDWHSVAGGTFFEGAFQSSITSLQELTSIFWNRVTHRYK